MKKNTNNLKHLALKLFYILLGWSAIIFLGMLVSFLCNHGMDIIPHKYLTPYLTPAVDMDIVMMITNLLLLYILIFSNWLCFDLLGTIGISSLFFIAEEIAIIVAGIISLWIMGMLGIDISIYNATNSAFHFSMMLSFFEDCLFLLLFPILYWLWCDILKMRKYCVYISKELRYGLYFLILMSPLFAIPLLYIVSE